MLVEKFPRGPGTNNAKLIWVICGWTKSDDLIAIHHKYIWLYEAALPGL